MRVGNKYILDFVVCDLLYVLCVMGMERGKDVRLVSTVITAADSHFPFFLYLHFHTIVLCHQQSCCCSCLRRIRCPPFHHRRFLLLLSNGIFCLSVAPFIQQRDQQLREPSPHQQLQFPLVNIELLRMRKHSGMEFGIQQLAKLRNSLQRLTATLASGTTTNL